MKLYPNIVASFIAIALSLSLAQPAFAELRAIEQAQPANMPEIPVTDMTAQDLAFLAQNQSEPEDKRVQALERLALFPNENSLVAVARGLKDKNSTIRKAAIKGTAPYPMEHRYRMVAPLLTDEDESVRFAAIAHIIQDFDQLPMGQQAKMRNLADELINTLEDKKTYADKLMLADTYRLTHRHAQAQIVYQSLLDAQDRTADLYLRMANNYHQKNDNHNALKVLEMGIDFDSDNANLHYSKALTLVRLEQKPLAAESILIANELAPQNAYYWYLSGVLQEPLNINLAINAFEQAYLLSGAPEHMYTMCDIYIRAEHKNTEQCLSALADIAPAEVIADLRSKQVGS